MPKPKKTIRIRTFASDAESERMITKITKHIGAGLPFSALIRMAIKVMGDKIK